MELFSNGSLSAPPSSTCCVNHGREEKGKKKDEGREGRERKERAEKAEGNKRECETGREEEKGRKKGRD